MPIGVVAHDPAWSSWFARERDLLLDVLAPWLSGGVHHIGSTAVPGLAAKPVIDMIAGVRDLAEAAPAISVLAGHGYVHSPHRPRAYRFHRAAGTGEHTHHLHLTEPGSDLWQERFAFRDALRASPRLRREYEALKLDLAARHDRVANYTAAKRSFVARVLADAGISLPPQPADTRAAYPNGT